MTKACLEHPYIYKPSDSQGDVKTQPYKALNVFVKD